MSDPPIPAPRAATPPRPEQLHSAIRKLASDGRISYTAHALKRMEERGFDRFDVKNVLLDGRVVGPIEPGAREGEWKVKLVDKPTERREKWASLPSSSGSKNY